MARGRPAIEPGDWGEISAWEESDKKTGRTWWRASVIVVTPLGEHVRRRATRPTRGAAIKAVREMARETAADTTTETATVKPTTTIAELIPIYLDHREEDLSPRSRKIYENVFANHIEPTIGGLQIRQTTTAAVDTFLHKLSPGTSKTSQALLSGAFSQAARWGVIDHNPVRGTTRPRAKPRDPEALDGAQMAEYRARVKAYQTADAHGPTNRAEPLGRLVDVFAGTGARPAELLAARWEDLDLDSTPATMLLRGTKTENAPRCVQLPAFAVAALKAQRRSLGAAADLHPYVWQTGNGTPISVSSLNRWFRAVRDHWAEQNPNKEDPLPNVTGRAFRKTVATIIADEVGEYEASRQLGHGDTAVTRRHYIQAPPLGPDVSQVLEDHLRTK
ncbi:tyrosine recombinase XerC [Corynebacterium hansenii]|uniref:Tyrosine recombinase XerC n=1 Tax=Corynebacterium hansenii TaxID=394964 RepID=A0ABV7ZQ23_9CORY|nr:site-specific tyrosine recombinase XerC [Corynebacterium hansenii]